MDLEFGRRSRRRGTAGQSGLYVIPHSSPAFPNFVFSLILTPRCSAQVIGSIIGIIVVIGVAVGVGVGISQSNKNSSSGSKSGGSSGSGTVPQTDPNDPSTFVKDDRLKKSFYGMAYTPENSLYPECGNSLGEWRHALSLSGQTHLLISLM